jgi:pimeloyl-ACP methyl ester carboxylesterase
VLAHDLYAELMGLAAPTLVVFANDDAIVPAAMSAALADIVPGAERLVFETGGHFTPVTRAEAYHARVRAFLTGDAP